jgi:hypothetical protein
MTTEMLSTAPAKKSAARLSQRLRENPKTIIAAPKAATLHKRAGPARRKGGRCASQSAMRNAPTNGAARR